MMQLGSFLLPQSFSIHFVNRYSSSLVSSSPHPFHGTWTHSIHLTPFQASSGKTRFRASSASTGSSSSLSSGGEKGKVNTSRGSSEGRLDPSGQQFVKSLSVVYPKLPCRTCKGRGVIICTSCKGVGTLPKGGYHRRNPVNLNRIIGSKWTAMERTFGRTHFRVESKKRMATGQGVQEKGRGPRQGKEGGGGGDASECREVQEEQERERRSVQGEGDGEGGAGRGQERSSRTSSASSSASSFVEMVATCDENVRFWVNAQNLKDRERWNMGWLQKAEMERVRAEARGEGGGGTVCKACTGMKEVACKKCSDREEARREGGGNTAGNGTRGVEGGWLDIIEV